MAQLRDGAASTPVNLLRAEVLDHAVGRAGSSPGLFTLTVPTGGGKTLAPLSFALEHAARHGMRRVIYVIPFTSIVEQTARVFREALGTEADVLEHHASFDWDRAESVAAADSEGRDGVRKLRRAAENWDAPVVVTTAVQFFESLFSNRRSRCRKLHNLAGAVIVLDEAQTLPVHLLRPSLAALQELAANYGASIVVCTATQPAWREAAGLDSISQAAGRCNREGRPEPGRMVVFEPAEAKPPRGLVAFWQVGAKPNLDLDAPLIFRACWRAREPGADMGPGLGSRVFFVVVNQDDAPFLAMFAGVRERELKHSAVRGRRRYRRVAPPTPERGSNTTWPDQHPIAETRPTRTQTPISS